MTTQFERDQMRRATEARRLLALIDAATAALPAVEDPDSADDLRKALKAYPDAESMRSSIKWYDREDERRAAEGAARVEAGERAFAELPDAPERRQCEVHVARDMGRWTDFGRCEKQATRIVMDYDAKRERCLCTLHAKEFARGDKPGTGFARIGTKEDVPTHESWYRIKGWCMAPDPHPDARKPVRYCRVKVDTGRGTHEGKEHKFS